MERWPASGALVLLAVGSISGDGTAKQRHEERSPGRWDGSPSDVANFGTWELGNLGTSTVVRARTDCEYGPIG
jgi:hypothetical protein